MALPPHPPPCRKATPAPSLTTTPCLVFVSPCHHPASLNASVALTQMHLTSPLIASGTLLPLLSSTKSIARAGPTSSSTNSGSTRSVLKTLTHVTLNPTMSGLSLHHSHTHNLHLPPLRSAVSCAHSSLRHPSPSVAHANAPSALTMSPALSLT